MRSLTSILSQSEVPLLLRGVINSWSSMTGTALAEDFGSVHVSVVRGQNVNSPHTVGRLGASIRFGSFREGILNGSLADGYIFEDVSTTMAVRVPELKELYTKVMRSKRWEFELAPEAAEQQTILMLGGGGTGNSYRQPASNLRTKWLQIEACAACPRGLPPVRHGCRWHSHGEALNMVTAGQKHWLIMRPQTTWPSTWPSAEVKMPMHAWLDAAAAMNSFRSYWSQYLWRCMWLGSESNQRRSRQLKSN